MAKWQMVRSLLKAADILETIGESENGLRLNEIAARLDMNATTAHNLIRTLAARGLLRKDDNVYAIGPTLESLVDRHRAAANLACAERETRELAKAIPETVVVLTEVAYAEIVIRLRISPDRPGVVQRPTDKTLNPFASVSGLLHLAFAREDLESTLRSHSFEDYGVHRWGSKERLNDHLASIRKLGFSSNAGVDKSGFRVAAPVWDGGDVLRHAIGVHLTTEKTTKAERKRVTNLVLRAAEELSA